MSATQRAGRWLGGLLSEDRFEVLFGLLLALLVSAAFVRSSVASALVTSGIVVAAMLVTFRSSAVPLSFRSSATRLSLLLVVMAVASGAAVLALSLASSGSPQMRAMAYLLVALTLVIGPPLVLRRVFQHLTVTVQDILAALAVFLQAGLAFAFVYAAVDEVAPNQFLSPGESELTTDYIYFSFITMLTVGYGDLTPASDLGRMVVIIQALLGQILLVVLIAYLVGAVVARARPGGSRPEREGPGTEPTSPRA